MVPADNTAPQFAAEGVDDTCGLEPKLGMSDFDGS
jgi:hypothetical protein